MATFTALPWLVHSNKLVYKGGTTSTAINEIFKFFISRNDSGEMFHNNN